MSMDSEPRETSFLWNLTFHGWQKSDLKPGLQSSAYLHQSESQSLLRFLSANLHVAYTICRADRADLSASLALINKHILYLLGSGPVPTGDRSAAGPTLEDCVSWWGGRSKAKGFTLRSARGAAETLTWQSPSPGMLHSVRSAFI